MGSMMDAVIPPAVQCPPFDLPQFQRWLCQASGQNCARAAALLGVSRSTLRRWLAGHQRVPWSTWCLVYLLGSGDLGALDRAWCGWSIEDGHLVFGKTLYTPAQIRTYPWFERQNHNLVAQLRAMENRTVPLGTEQARLIQATRHALAHLVEQAQNSQALLAECLSNDEIYQKKRG